MLVPAAASATPLRLLARLPNGAVISHNWSGYAVTGPVGSVTAAKGSWIVPAANCDNGLRRNTGASFWVGIDGYNSATVEQSGTDSDCSKGVPKYYAWYEFVPKRGITIKSLTIHVGDIMSASVVYEGSEFKVTTTDETTGQSFSIAKPNPRAKRDSAEWIAEDNSYHFTNFGTASFGQDNTNVIGSCEATVDGVTNPIGAFAKVHEIEMASHKGRTLAAPSALTTDGTSFTVKWH
jgi:hypothetical protein